MQKVPLNRLFFYFLALAWLPTIWSVADFLVGMDKLRTLEKERDYLVKTLSAEIQKQSINQITHQTYKNANMRYLQDHLEALSFLNKEKERLSRMSQSGHLGIQESLFKRLAFLTGKQNQLVFIQGKGEKYSQFKEVVEALSHPVEIDTDDLKQILAYVENVSIDEFHPKPNAPQFIIKDFKLERQSRPDQNEFFKLDMKLIKREF